MSFAQGLTATQATEEHDTVQAQFDPLAGVWTVRFSLENTLGGDQTVTLDPTGTILESPWGE